MKTQAEKQFEEDFKAYKNLFVLNGFKGKDKIINWIKRHGKLVLEQAEKEITSGMIKRRLKTQSGFEKEEMQCMKKVGPIDTDEDEQ